MKKMYALIISLVINIGSFIYLTTHHYALKLGVSESSLCAINSKINCDAAALSSYSEVFGIPVAVAGFIFNILMLGAVLFFMLHWIQRSQYAVKLIQGLLGLATLVSIVMACISFFVIQVLCPFCTVTYVFTIFAFALSLKAINPDEKEFTWQGYMGEYKSHLIFMASIPLITWLSAGMLSQNYGLTEFNKVIPEKIALWKNSQMFNFNKDVGLLRGPADAKATIVEFADFKCGHCKVAHTTLKKFLDNRPDVQFVFKPFPLDGNCSASPDMPKGDNSRCLLAGWALCSEKLFKKGWAVQSWIFDQQENIGGNSNLKPFLDTMSSELSIDGAALQACAESAETFETIKSSSQEGMTAMVRGTPTIYVNGRKLDGGQFIEVLKRAISEL